MTEEKNAQPVTDAKLAIAVVIPAYEPPHSLVSYVRELLDGVVERCIVVNDGSGEGFASLFAALSELPGCTVLGYEKNRGRGFALRQGFACCREQLDERYVCVTADCDGRYTAEDIRKTARCAAEHPAALSLGARARATGVGENRRGDVVIRLMLKVLYGLPLTDARTDLRACPYTLLEQLEQVAGNRFEYDMNTLIRLHRKEVPIVETPVAARTKVRGEIRAHYRRFSDNGRLILALLKSLDYYILSSVASAAADVLAFYVTLNFVFTFSTLAVNTLLATVTARVLSSVINYLFNFKLVFRGKSKKSVFRYYCLWMAQLGCSYAITYIWCRLFSVSLSVSVMKAVSDLLLAAFSYQIQLHWVFKTDAPDPLHFYGPFFRVTRWICNRFTPKYRSRVTPQAQPVVYVCRHLNMHGPYTLCRYLDFDVHMLVLEKFFSFRECRKQFGEYTFTDRYHRKGTLAVLGRVWATLAACAVPPMVRSIRSVPVYRGGGSALITLRRTAQCLYSGENIAVFPDVDYTAGSTTPSEIYRGFLLLDKLWYRKSKQHLVFVPLHIDDERHEIRECPPVRFNGDVPFREELKRVAADIKNELNV